MSTISQERIDNESIVELIAALQSIDTPTSKTVINKDSIEDNNGGRIEL